MKAGDQIAYIPDRAKKEGIIHPDTEFGFVFSISIYDNEKIFCRYWVKGKPGTLRTRANSELTDIRDLALHESVSIETVKQTIKEIVKEQKEND